MMSFNSKQRCERFYVGAECFLSGLSDRVRGVGLATYELLDGLNVAQFLKCLYVTGQITVRYAQHGPTTQTT